jgi:hypothetical protein
MSYTMSNRCSKPVIYFRHRFGRAQKIEQRRQRLKLTATALESSCLRRPRPLATAVLGLLGSTTRGSTTRARRTANLQALWRRRWAKARTASRSAKAQVGDSRGVGERRHVQVMVEARTGDGGFFNNGGTAGSSTAASSRPSYRVRWTPPSTRQAPIWHFRSPISVGWIGDSLTADA